MIQKPTQLTMSSYKLVKDSYYGNGGYITGEYLWKNPRELNYASRQQEAVYINLMKPIIDARLNPVFVNEPTRVYEPSMVLDGFLDNCDNNGTKLEDMIKSETLDTLLMSNSFLIMESFPESEIPNNTQDLINERKYPYVYSKSVLDDVYSWETDTFGALTEITFNFGVYNSYDDEELYVYKRYTSSEIELFTMKKDDEGGVSKITLSKNSHGLGIIPIAYYNKDVMSFSEYYSMARLAQKTYNTESKLGELENTQSFSVLLIPSINPEGASKTNIIVSKNNALFYNANNTNKPEYIAPDANMMKTLMEKSDATYDRLIQSADVLGTTAIANGNSATSGRAEAYRFFGKQYALLETSAIASDLDKQIVDIFGLFVGQDFNYEVKYDDNFNPTFNDINQQIIVLEKIAGAEMSDMVTNKANATIVEMIAPFVGWESEEVVELQKSIAEYREIV